MLDFDLFMSEKEKETITVKVYGKEYLVPAKMPAVVPLMMARAEKLADQSSRNAAFVSMIFNAADALFGTRQMDDICSKGMDVEQLSMLIQKVFNVINGAEEDDGEVTELSDEDSRTKLPGGTGAKK